MLRDRYDLALTTASAAARDAYVRACGLALTFYPGAIEAYDRAIAADPGFALAHAGKAQVLMRQGDVTSARVVLEAAKDAATGLSEREASHIGFFDLMFAGRTDAAITALYIVIPLTRTAEPVGKQVMGLQLAEHSRPLPRPIAQDAGHRQLRIVVEDRLRYPRRRSRMRRCARRKTLRWSPPDRPAQSRRRYAAGRPQRSGSCALPRRSPPAPHQSPPAHGRDHAAAVRRPRAAAVGAPARSP